METSGVVALSAFVIGIALAGTLSSLRIRERLDVRVSLALVFILFAGLSALPVVSAYLTLLYSHFLPALLPMLIVLPVAVHRQAEARTGAPYTRRAVTRDAILPVTGLLVMMGYWLLPEGDRTAMLIYGQLPGGISAATLALVTFGLILVWIGSSAAYLTATLRALYRHRQTLKALYSNTHGLELRWVDAFLISLAGLWTLSALALASENLALGVTVTSETLLAGTALVLLVLIAVSLKEPVHPQAGEILTTAPSVAPAKYARSALSEEHAIKIAQRVEAAMARDQLHLDPNLSLAKLASHVATPANLVSQTLNEHLGASFFDYVAKWRVKTAKPRIARGEASVLTIAMDVGFNTRSTFYKAFKRETGMTPKAYRDSMKAKR